MKKLNSDTFIEVIINDLSVNPVCEHGPTLLFRKKSKETNDIIEEYFACSACRDLSFCSFHLPSSKNDFLLSDGIICSNNFNCNDFMNKFKQVLKLGTKDRGYCASCNSLLASKELFSHKNHKLISKITNHQLLHPSTILPPLDNDKREAQYFFASDTLHTLGSILKSIKTSKLICIGTPRLHEYVRGRPELQIKSFLLDFDSRFHSFYSPEEFSHFNMFNNHFFGGRDTFDEFLKSDDDANVCLVTDPPFGCRTEPLANTLQLLSQHFRQVNSTLTILPIMLVFPYFMETYVQKVLPQLEILDYKVNYTNHGTYHDGVKGRIQGSPVRIFTNIEQRLIKLPRSDGYKFCSLCQKWSSIENKHCRKCKRCPSKNGTTYVHCDKCEMCVKPNYIHCDDCDRCAQCVGHNCSVYQANQLCWICRRKGHIERNCKAWQAISKIRTIKSRMKKKCLICGKTGHNEKNCIKRWQRLKETYFMGEFVNELNLEKNNL